MTNPCLKCCDCFSLLLLSEFSLIPLPPLLYQCSVTVVFRLALFPSSAARAAPRNSINIRVCSLCFVIWLAYLCINMPLSPFKKGPIGGSVRQARGCGGWANKKDSFSEQTETTSNETKKSLGKMVRRRRIRVLLATNVLSRFIFLYYSALPTVWLGREGRTGRIPFSTHSS